MTDFEAECLRALALVRTYTRKHGPYMSTVLFGLVPYFEKGMGTLAVTDKMVLLVDPEWFTTMPVEMPKLSNKTDEVKYEEYARLRMQAGCVMHECNHVIRDMGRMARLDNQDIANIAFDLPINSDLEKITHEDPVTKQQVRTWDLPPWACYPKTYKLQEGLTGEQYYELLMKQSIKVKLTGVGGGKCGGCVKNPANAAAEAGANAAVGRTTADTQRIKKAATEDIKKHFAGAGRGTMPAGYKFLLDEKPEKASIVPWRVLFSHICRKATGRIVSGRSDYSLSRPSKRSYMGRILRPGLIDRKVMPCFIEDTSGSMGPQQLLHTRIEFIAIMKQLGIPEAWFMDADAAVSSPPKKIKVNELLTMPFHGGGGTDFRPAIELALKLRPKPDIIVYSTDGDGAAPKYAPPGVEFIWCIVPTPYGRRPAPWGHLVICADDQQLRDPYMFDMDDDDEDDE